MIHQYLTTLLEAYRRGHKKRSKDRTNAPRKYLYFKVKASWSFLMLTKQEKLSGGLYNPIEMWLLPALY